MRLFKIRYLFTAIGLLAATAGSGSAHATDNYCAGGSQLPVINASSDYEGSKYVASRAIDDNLNNWSRWTSKGQGESIILDLGSTKSINQVQVLWLEQGSRTSFFDVETSANGSDWQRVLSSAEAKDSSNMLNFNVQSTVAQYVKIIGQGNSSNEWNALIEARVIDCPNEIPPQSCTSLDNLLIDRAFSAYEYDANHSPDKAIDNSLSPASRWSSKGLGNSMTFELADESIVREIRAAFLKGDVRQSYFEIQTSKNNQDWTTVLSNGVAEGSLGPLRFDLTDSSAKFVKYIGMGNSATRWNSIVELNILGCGTTDNNVPSPPDQPSPTEPNNPGDNSIELIQQLFEIEGGEGNLSPIGPDNTLVFDAMKARHVTPNGNGWRHEYKMAKENRKDMYDTSEDFSARITPTLSTGSKTIVAQYHGGGLGTLVKVYISDTNEFGHDDSQSRNGIFDVYARLKTSSSQSETIVNFGTIRSGENFDLTITNREGLVSVSAMGMGDSLLVSNSDEAYFKFGNYLQAENPDNGNNVADNSDWEDFYSDQGIQESIIIFSNITYLQH